MRAEAQPIIDTLGLIETYMLPPALPMRSFQGQSEKHEFCIVIGGVSPRYQVDNVGTEPAAVGLQAALSVFDADLVMNAGTAGGFEAKGAEIADVYLGKAPIRYHDHRIPVHAYTDYAKGVYPCIDSKELAEKLGLKRGSISTSNSLDYNDDCWRIMKENQADCKEMECAALAWICDLYQKPFLPIKAITDLVDHEHPTSEQFQKNLAKTCQALKEAVIRVLEEIE